MKTRKFVLLLIIVLAAFTLFSCVPDDGINNASSVKPAGSDSTGDGSTPERLEWSVDKNSSVHIVDMGLHPKTETVTIDFGYDTIGMKKKGYTTLDFKLSFDARIDSGISVSTNIEAYFTDKNKKEFGVGWGNLTFTNTSAHTYEYEKSISIDKLLQNRGKIYLTFTAVSNTLFTGTYISNIHLDVFAE